MHPNSVLIKIQPDAQIYQGDGKSLARSGRGGNKRGSMSGTGAISTTSRRELSSSFFLQGKTPKEIYAILTETLACFLPGRARDLSAPLYLAVFLIHFISAAVILLSYLALMFQLSLPYNRAGRPVYCVVLSLFSLKFSMI